MKRDLDAVVARPPAALSLATAPVLACALAVVIEVAAVRARRKRAFDELRMSATPPRPSMLGARGIR